MLGLTGLDVAFGLFMAFAVVGPILVFILCVFVSCNVLGFLHANLDHSKGQNCGRQNCYLCKERFGV